MLDVALWVGVCGMKFWGKDTTFSGYNHKNLHFLVIFAVMLRLVCLYQKGFAVPAKVQFTHLAFTTSTCREARSWAMFWAAKYWRGGGLAFHPHLGAILHQWIIFNTSVSLKSPLSLLLWDSRHHPCSEVSGEYEHAEYFVLRLRLC